MARNRTLGRKAEKGQLGFIFDGPSLLPEAASPAGGIIHVRDLDQKLSHPLPARTENRADQGTQAPTLPGTTGGSHAGHPEPPAGATGGALSADEPVAAGNGSGSPSTGDVSSSLLASHYAELQQNGLYGLAPERAIMRVDLPPHEATQIAIDAGTLLQAGFIFQETTKAQTSHVSSVALPLQPPNPLPPSLAGVSHALSDRFRLEDTPAVSGLKRKARATLDALRQLKQLEAEDRDATEEEKHILAGFSGFGPLANHIFPEPGTGTYKEGWAILGQELAELLTVEEYASAKRSTFNAFYTSPTVMEAIYDGLTRMGVPSTGAHVLEPGCGIGNFIGMAPSGMQFTAIEQEVLSGRIARALYPDQDIRIEPFQKSVLPAGSLDVVVGNVPFSDLTLKWQDGKLALHEYFFAKSLDSLREGGILALVTSRYTLDKKDPSFREYLAGQADFLGAMRLPKGAFRQEGTEVVTDIVFLRKRPPAQAPAHAAGWLETAALPDQEAYCNQYFLTHPTMVVGELAQYQGMYRNHELTVTFPDDYTSRLQAALAYLPADAYLAPPDPALDRPQARAAPATPSRSLPPGSRFIDAAGHILHITDQAGTAEPLIYGGKPLDALSGATGTRLAALIGIREAARAVLDTQREQRTDEEKETARTILNQRYDQFVEQWGPINKTSISTTSDGVTVRRQPNLTAFKDDPDAYLVMALEQYDEKTDSAIKMPIMERDVIGPTPPVHQVASALDGLLVSLNQRGAVDLDYISTLYGASPEDITRELGSYIYYDPAQGRYVTAEEYLSGNVRAKLRLARDHADDARVGMGIAALEEAQPDPVPPGDIDVTLGAAWIPAPIIQTFIAELLHCEVSEIAVRYVEKEALWSVDAPAWVKGKVEAISTYGTAERPALSLIHDALNMRVPTVMTTVRIDGSDRQIPDQEATLAAREKQKAIKESFQQWLFADPVRADELVTRYNQQFNSTRLRQYDGSHLTFPGINPDIELRPHQKDAIWRVMNGHNTLLAHAVGAGKTFEMIASGMKMKQCSLVRKPLYVVPNHMLEQFSREFYLLYPDAQLLVASKEDLAKANRKLFTAKAASGEWDGVIMTHSSFEKIGMSPAFQESFVREQIADYEALLTDMKTGADEDAKRLIKRVEKQKEQWEQRLEDLTNHDRKDSGLTFEDLGVDHLFVDEAHLFKNLETPTKMGQVAGVQTSGSLRAFDLFMKTRYLDTSGHGTTFATGTPVSNSMVEMYTMSRFLAPELLQERGISHFDGWAAVFGDIVDTVELSPDAQSLRQNRRFARFVNLPELLQIFHSFADVKTADMLDLPCPALKGGKAEVIATPMTDYQKRIQESLVDRYERVRSGAVDPREDNALKITTDGRKLALDARLMLPHLPETESKIDALAENVYHIWQQTQESRATQLIFCDLGVGDKDGQFSVYHAICRKLTALGIPDGDIAAIGDYGTDSKKAQLFARVQSGDVRILLGSTQKMGTGTNVQQRLIALHHADAPWKPAEVEQREGRILRQGNLHDEVEIYRYVTEGSFDAYMWQTLQTKAEFINQVMKGDMSIRRMEDMDEQTLSYAEVKAIASGNPAVLTLAKIEMEAQRLTQLSRAHTNEQYRIRQTIRQLEDADLITTERRLARINADIATMEAHGHNQPDLVLNGQRITDPQTAQDSLREVVERQWEILASTLENAPPGAQERVTLGHFGGLEIQLSLEKGHQRLSGALSLKGQYRTSRSLRGPGSDRLFAYIQELAASLPALKQETEEEQATLEVRLDGLQTRLGLPFEHDAKLAQLTVMRSELQMLLQADAPAPAYEMPSAPEVKTSVASPAATWERIQIIVTAFDTLMKGNIAPAPAISPSVMDVSSNPPARRWVDKIRSPEPSFARERLEVII